jgi:hypothetical protein
MARESNEQRLSRIHQEAMAEFDAIQSALRDERLQCLQDRRFYSIAGAQWEGPLGAQFENKPKLEVNKIALAVQRIFSEYRSNRVTVDFVSKEGKEYDSLADACDQLFRADEQDSNAEEAYDNAFADLISRGDPPIVTIFLLLAFDAGSPRIVNASACCAFVLVLSSFMCSIHSMEAQLEGYKQTQRSRNIGRVGYTRLLQQGQG